MRNYTASSSLLIIAVFLMLTGCVQEVASYACEQTHKMFLRPVKCKAAQYNLYIDSNESKLKERFELADEITGCFALVPRVGVVDAIKIVPAVVAGTDKSTILEVRAYRANHIVDLHSYKFNMLNLQDKINESVSGMYTTLKKKDGYK